MRERNDLVFPRIPAKNLLVFFLCVCYTSSWDHIALFLFFATDTSDFYLASTLIGGSESRDKCFLLEFLAMLHTFV